MFFRRVFSRKEQSSPNNKNVQTLNSDPQRSPYRGSRRSSMDEKQRNASVIQLTPLWEHIIRTKYLPDNIDEKEMFDEFGERLRDPEWQVRQHALRVLVDVLIVMGPRSDQFFAPLILPLVENLSHGTTAVRKGALDALKVYMTETAMPETILLEIINLGLEQKHNSEQNGGRICIGVMLSLPSLVHTAIGTPKQNYLLKAVIDALTAKMIQITYQEIALKALLRIRELIGGREFSEYMSHSAFREFELLCNVYGLPSSPMYPRDTGMQYLRSNSDSNRKWGEVPASAESSNCKVKRTELSWREPNDVSYDEEGNPTKIRRKFHSASKVLVGPPKDRLSSKDHEKERVIMETEIKIQDTAVTMRIFEASNENEISCSEEDELSSVYEHSGVVRVLTDSELDETNNSSNDKEQNDNNSGRNTATGIKRVTFGGEEFKLRTPDSDSVLQSDNDDLIKAINKIDKKTNFTQENKDADKKQNNLTVSRPKTASLVISKPTSPMKDNTTIRHKSASPSKRRRASFSSIEDLQVSPRSTHSGIEVLHNLQRSPLISPSRSRRNSTESFIGDDNKKVLNPNSLKEKLNETIIEENSGSEIAANKSKEKEKITSWESLGLVDDQCIKNIKSGDWRLRSHAMCTIEEVLKSTENLALIQPHLESLFRTLLSSEKHLDVIEDKRRIIINLISRLPLENLESRVTQILLGLCRQGGSSSNRVAKALMQRLPPSAVLMKLISDDFLKARSSRFRENTLQMVLYSLMTFPSTHFDITTCVRKSALAANDRKKRVRQAALDVLAVLGQISSPKFVLDEVIQTLKNENEAFHLIAAIKARLSRKQLPSVTVDGNVQYALRIPTPPTNSSNYFFGADVDWITAGVGSVSPTSPKKRFDLYPSSHSYNYSSSDSNRSSTENYTRAKPLAYEAPINFPLNPNYDFNESNSNGNLASNITGSKDSLHRTLNDDRNTHFVIATSIPSTDVPFLFNGGLQRMNVQSQSFPDLSKQTIGKTGHYTQNRINANSNKSSKLPVASRFPSMEANIEAERKSDTSYFSNGPIRSNLINRNGGSLPKKLNLTNIPMRNGYYHYNNYSHVTPDYQSSNDESRPSTHPIENIQQPNPKRFINVNKYLNDRSSTDYSSDEKFSNDFGYKEQPKPVIIDIPLKDYKKSTSDEISSGSSPKREESVETISNELSSEGISGTSTPTRPLSAKLLNTKDGSLSTSSETLRPNSPPTPSTVVAKIIPDVSASQQEAKTIVNKASGAIANDEVTPANSGTSDADTVVVHESKQLSNNKNTQEMIDIGSATNKPMAEADDKNEKSDVITTKDAVDGRRKSYGNDDEFVGSPRTSSGYVIGDKAIALDGSGVKSDSDSRSLSSSDASSDSHLNLNNEKINRDIPLDVGSKAKCRPSFLMRKRKVAAIKPSPLTTHSSSPKSKSSDMFPKNLRHFDRAREASANCLNQLDSQSWEIVIKGLQNFVRLIRHHPEIVEANLHAYCVGLSKQVKNLRSQVSRSACQASAEFFESHAKQLEQESDDLATQLFNRTADTNKFLRADAMNALNAMCDNLPVTKVIQTVILRGATHQNAVVRAAAAALCSRIVLRLGCDKVFTMNREYRDKLILAGGNFLMEGSLETRNNAKTMFKQLSTHPNYNRVLLDVIPQRIYRNIEKSLKSIK